MDRRIAALGKLDTPALSALVRVCLCACALNACRLDTDVHSATRLVVSIEVERAVRVRSQELQVGVAQAGSSLAAAGAEPQQLERLALAGADDDHVKRLTITPQGGQKAPYVCITVTARGPQDDPLAAVQARVVTRFVRGEAHEVRLALRADCLAVACRTGETCEAGSCVEALRRPGDLPLVHAADAGRVLEDAAPEAPADAAVPDAAEVDTTEPPIVTHVSRVVTVDEDAGTGDACAAAHGGCDPLVACYGMHGQVTCGLCPRGFEDVHNDGTQCRDIDECRNGQAGCAEHARCTNSPGGFECTCDSGYGGDGHSCKLADLCGADADCGGLAGSCQTGAEGRRSCVCPQGYRLIGSTCVDIDECTTGALDCGPHGTCMNAPGSAQCQCAKGYVLTAGTCKDVDECAAKQSDCDLQPSACVNTDGSFSCKCPAGYNGSGRGEHGCELANPCKLDNGGCDAHRDCLNTDGGPTCGDCQPGYRKSGPKGCERE